MKDYIKKLYDNKYFPYFLMGGVIAIICFFIIIYFTFFYTKKVSYSNYRSVIKNAAVNYCNDNCNTLFDNNDSVVVPVETLMNKGYMSSFQKMYDDSDISCDGKVTINKNYNNYNYIVNVDCGDAYKDKTINDYFSTNVHLVETGDGLYSFGNYKVYRGEYVNNYVLFDKTLFRIVRINSDNSLTLVLDDYSKNINGVWDDRYNSTYYNNFGFNDYLVSRAQEFLHSIMTIEDYKGAFKKSINYDYCIGSKSSSSTKNDYSEVCSKTVSDYIGLLTVDDIIISSLDKNCNSVENSMACQNYNYISKYDRNFWLMTSDNENTKNVYRYDIDEIDAVKCSSRSSFRFILTISGDEIYKSGDGSKEKPFVLK